MEIKNTIYTFEDVKNVYSKYIHNPEELDKIYQAYLFASEKHKNQVRKSGDPYIVHLLGVARILSELNTGPTTIIAGLLHDTIEDTVQPKKKLQKNLGKKSVTLFKVSPK